MGDRVDERREADRLLQQQLDKQRAENKVTTNKQEFAKVANQVSKARAGTQQRQRKNQGTQGRAAQRLTARSGIANQLVARMANEGDARLAKNRANAAAGDRGNSERSAAQVLVNEKAATSAGAHMPVNSRETKEEGRDESRGKGRETAAAGERAVVATGGGHPLSPIAGAAGQAGAAGHAGATRETTQALIDHLVKEVRSARIDKKPSVQITLQDSVLHGARLNFRHDSDGIFLDIESGNRQVQELFSRGENARALASQLKGQNIVLKGLRVGGKAVALT